MKSTNIKIDKEKKPSKIKNAFNKFVLTATALAVFSCGGAETTERQKSNNNLPTEIAQIVNEKELTNVYDATQDLQVIYNNKIDEELTLIKEELHSFCNNKYPIEESHYNSSKNFFYVSIKNKSSPTEFFFRTLSDELSEYDLPRELTFNEESVIIRNHKRATSTDIGLFFFYMGSNEILNYLNSTLSGFAYIIPDVKEKEINSSPYLMLCKYHNKRGTDMGIGRFVILPNKMFWDTVDSVGASRDYVKEYLLSIKH
jgi:hypothetical protein